MRIDKINFQFQPNVHLKQRELKPLDKKSNIYPKPMNVSTPIRGSELDIKA